MPTPEKLGSGDHEEWLRFEEFDLMKQEHATRLRVVHLLFGLMAVVIVFGLGTLALCAYLDLEVDAIVYFLASVLAILSAAFGGAIGFLFGRGRTMFG